MSDNPDKFVATGETLSDDQGHSRRGCSMKKHVGDIRCDISPELSARFDAMIAKLKDRFPDANLFPDDSERVREVRRAARSLPIMRYCPPSDDIETITIHQNWGLPPFEVRKP